MTNTLIYIDETDRSYGLSGMAVTLAALNSEEKILEINIDRSPDPIDFVPDFYFFGNPRFSAKHVWDELAQNFQLSLAMALGNLLSRRQVGADAALTDLEIQTLREIAEDEGAEICGLEADEFEEIWDKDLRYVQRIFSIPSVRRLTRALAEELRQRRSLSRHEFLELLARYNR